MQITFHSNRSHFLIKRRNVSQPPLLLQLPQSSLIALHLSNNPVQLALFLYVIRKLYVRVTQEFLSELDGICLDLHAHGFNADLFRLASESIHWRWHHKRVNIFLAHVVLGLDSAVIFNYFYFDGFVLLQIQSFDIVTQFLLVHPSLGLLWDGIALWWSFIVERVAYGFRCDVDKKLPLNLLEVDRSIFPISIFFVAVQIGDLELAVHC